MNISMNISAEVLLGPPILPPDSRGWAHWWCPFHVDTARSAARPGERGRPNFGIHLPTGRYKCLRCGASGPSLLHLARRLAQDGKLEGGVYRAVQDAAAPIAPPPPDGPPAVSALDEALAACRGVLLSSPAMAYLRHRGIKPATAMLYGLGYGLPHPYVSRSAAMKGYEARLITKGGTWIWAGGVVYADPLTHPRVINVRYLPDEYLPHGHPFEVREKHHTWGRRETPLGGWRIQATTSVLLVVEGLFDFLAGAQVVNERGMYPDVVVVYTNGAAPSALMLDWFRRHGSDYTFLLVPDQDKAGEDWEKAISSAVRDGGGETFTFRDYSEEDPDKAFLSGWFPV